MRTPTKWWHREEEQIVCDLCPRTCALHEGQRGFCFVRQNIGGEMELTTYGRSSGFCIDPIEKKPLNHFLPGTPVLSFGTAGCNLGCKFCQNWSISKSREIDLLADEASPEAIADAAVRSGCRSVAFTYNDPVIFAEYAIDTARACHDRGIKAVAVTAGYISPQAREEFYSVMDAANVDLKGFTEHFYKHVTLSHIEPVLDTLKWLKHESNVWFEITNLIIPGENDAEDETKRLCDWVVDELGPDVPVHFTAFHPDFRMQNTERTPSATLSRAREIALAAGLQFPYTGNVVDAKGQSTWCPHCGARLIERNWFELGRWNLRGNRCGSCDGLIPGVFDDRPGVWGAKRLPIRISQPAAVRGASVQPAAEESKGPGTLTQLDTSLTGSAPRTESKTMPATSPSLPQARTEFSQTEAAQILAHVRGVAAALFSGEPMPELSDDLAQSPVYGLFVTFKRGEILRACKGRFGAVQPLGELLTEVTEDSTTNDPRFPSIAREELPFLDVEVSIMFNPQDVAGPPEARIASVEVGRHGLVLSHPRGRGLLLPQVATEHGLDALQFLKATSKKAGLNPDAWRDGDSRLMTFEASIFDSPAVQHEFDVDVPSSELANLRSRANSAMHQRDRDAQPPVTVQIPVECGVVLLTSQGRLAAAVGEAGLSELTSRAGASLAGGASQEQIAHVLLLGVPLPLRAQDHSQRLGSLGQVVLLARRDDRWALHIAQDERVDSAIHAVLEAVDSDMAEWRSNPEVSVTAFLRTRSEPGKTGLNEFAGQSIVSHPVENVRKPARAGLFYPATADEIRQAVAGYLSHSGEGSDESVEQRAYRAVLLPHAGWMYCGEVVGQTLARVALPQTAIVIGPKHTAAGANWSVSSSDAWEYPGGSVPVAAELRRRLVQLVPSLEVEADAHAAEHAVEVLVPFLHALRPDLRILPIVLGSTSYSQTERLARGLHVLQQESRKPILLVISSDLNHFAREPENRRRDFLAIDAFCTGDAGVLFDTVRKHDVSMCGVMPAVAVLRALHDAGSPVQPQLVCYANSAAVSGDESRVVGYAGLLVP